jgi:NodT family efflux transporter outer membrane factor (OMF) lipoprotein
MKMHNRFITIASFLCLTSCTVGPNYVRPSVNIPAQFKEAKGKPVMGAAHSRMWKRAEPRDDFYRGEWWKIFHDQKLNELELELNRFNQTIVNAYQNYRQARALVDEARAAFLPTLAGSLDFTRQNTNSSSSFSSGSDFLVANGGGGKSSGVTSRISDNYTWSLNASWEPDIWGSVRRNVEAVSSAAQASAALLAATRLSEQASLAQFYFELRGLDADQALLNRTVKDYKQALTLTKNQYAAGVAARADVVQAQSQLETAQASAINNGVLRAQYEHAIAVLIGVPPAEFSLAPHPLLAGPPPIPLDIPSTLLERRPDVAQAERTVSQANAQIGVAYAAYFPALTLSGTASTIARKLFAVPFLNWSLSTELADTLFDGGLRDAAVKAAWATYCAEVAAYRQTVLAAFQDVEDNLASLRILANQAVVQNQAAASAREAERLVINQYKSGTVAYSNVITAQVSAYTAEKAAVDLNYLRMISAVGLIKALGGGWDASSICYAATNREKC